MTNTLSHEGVSWTPMKWLTIGLFRLDGGFSASMRLAHRHPVADVPSEADTRCPHYPPRPPSVGSPSPYRPNRDPGLRMINVQPMPPPCIDPV